MPGPIQRGRSFVENVLGDGVKEVNADSVSTEKLGSGSNPVEEINALLSRLGDAPIDYGTTAIRTDPETGRALTLQNLDDSKDLGEGRANLGWIGDNGEDISVITAHPSHNHLSVYTTEEEFGSGSNTLQKRLDIGGGSDFVETRFRWLSHVAFGGKSSDFYVDLSNPDGVGDPIIHAPIEVMRPGSNSRLKIRAGSPTGDAIVEFYANDGSSKWRAFYDSTLDGSWNLRDSETGSRVIRAHPGDTSHGDLRFSPPGDIDHVGSESKRVVWENGSDRPSSPNTGQRFFDSDLGQPIWYDGVDWVDANGDPV